MVPSALLLSDRGGHPGQRGDWCQCHGLELVKGLRFLCGGDGVLNNETGVFREGRFFLNGTTIVGSSHDWFLLSKMFLWVNTLSDEK